MRFGNVEFSDDLMNALRDDDLVIFAGAGVSIPEPSNLPSFDELIRKIETHFQVKRNCNEPGDHFLGRLEARNQDIRSYIVGQLSSGDPNPLHSDLLDIRPRGSEPKLVTTNFDQLFEATDKGREVRSSRKVYTAPALPPGGRFSGIANLHGTADEPGDMVLTDSDIGRAYLREGWALRFLQGLFETHHVLFVGYSHNDPIIRYLARATPIGDRPLRRFILKPRHEPEPRDWSSLGIEPIYYELGDDGSHGEMAEAIAELAEWQRRSSQTWRQLIAETASQPVPPADPKSQSHAEHALQDEELTTTFTDHAGSLEWVQWTLDRGYLWEIFRQGPITDRGSLLVRWAARVLTNEDPGEAIGIIAQADHKLNPALWWEIIQRLPTDGDPTKTGEIGRWASYLLTTAPSDQDRLKPDGLYRLARSCIAHGLHQEAASVFGEMCRTSITARGNAATRARPEKPNARRPENRGRTPTAGRNMGEHQGPSRNHREPSPGTGRATDRATTQDPHAMGKGRRRGLIGTPPDRTITIQLQGRRSGHTGRRSQRLPGMDG